MLSSTVTGLTDELDENAGTAPLLARGDPNVKGNCGRDGPVVTPNVKEFTEGEVEVDGYVGSAPVDGDPNEKIEDCGDVDEETAAGNLVRRQLSCPEALLLGVGGDNGLNEKTGC